MIDRMTRDAKTALWFLGILVVILLLSFLLPACGDNTEPPDAGHFEAPLLPENCDAGIAICYKVYCHDCSAERGTCICDVVPVCGCDEVE